jgi:hypothetical protein
VGVSVSGELPRILLKPRVESVGAEATRTELSATRWRGRRMMMCGGVAPIVACGGGEVSRVCYSM